MAATHPPYGLPLTASPMPGLETLSHFSAGFLALTLVTDYAYMQTTVLMWQDFSSWLLFFGLIAGGIAVLLWIIAAATRRLRPVWSVALLQLLVLVVAFVNSLIHAGDGWTAIVPWGIGASALTCVLMLGAALLNRRALRHRPLQRA
ncbi:MAG: hypothetical protein FJX25_02020 [Alphaproteobacteria bacterium]|nr:hypothetical protein [Alphaproteobacteria bacterium]